MEIKKLFDNIINEQSILKTSRTKPIVDAIKNRKPITFMYIGPRKPKKDSVKPGKRIKAEAVAIGLSKKGNLIVRAYVQPPSVSKKGFDKHGWRTFMVSRMSNVQIHDDETFNTQRPEYKSGDDKSMTVTYVTTDWNVQPKTKRITKPSKKPEKVEPKTTVEPITPKDKPEKPVEPLNKKIEPTLKPSEPEIKTTEPEVKPEKEIQPIPKKEKPEPPEEVKPETEPENDEENKLQETIKRFKSLIIY